MNSSRIPWRHLTPLLQQLLEPSVNERQAVGALVEGYVFDYFCELHHNPLAGQTSDNQHVVSLQAGIFLSSLLG